MTAALKGAALTKRFGGRTALDGVSFEVQAGEVVGLLGPNGAGKTTLLRLLVGLLTPSSGEAFVQGQEVRANLLAIRAQVGFMTASTGLYDRLTPREVLHTFGALYGMGAAAIASRVEALSRELDLGGVLDKRCGTLSSGQKQRVSIARAVVHDPALLLLDEPTAALDPVASACTLDLVQRSRAAGKAVLLSTHRMDEAEWVCDRILFLVDGRVVAEGSPSSLRQASGQASLAAVFLHYARLPVRA